MKRLVTIALVICIALFAGNAYGQQTQKKEKVKAQKEVKVKTDETEQEMEMEKEKEMEKVKEGEMVKEKEKEMEQAKEGEKVMEKEKEMDKIKEGDTDPKGNAYGQNKEGLEGKEFGQARANDARSKQHAKKSKKAKAPRPTTGTQTRGGRK